jgi:hypothetical protein
VPSNLLKLQGRDGYRRLIWNIWRDCLPRLISFVIPANAGIFLQLRLVACFNWIPAFAGMTGKVREVWVPTFVGMTEH